MTGVAGISVLDALGVQVYADGADTQEIFKLADHKGIKGFTTNPTLMRAAGIKDYESFAHELIARIPDRPISFEVFADDYDGMKDQAFLLSSWGANVYVKVPVSDTRGNFTGPLIAELAANGVKANVTAIMTTAQVRAVADALSAETPAVVSVFAGRIADTGIDPVPVMAECIEILSGRPLAELLWASPRELLNIFQADAIGCDIITVTPGLLKKLALVGKDLDEYSLETVQMFYRDATASGFDIGVMQRGAAE